MINQYNKNLIIVNNFLIFKLNCTDKFNLKYYY